MFESHNAESILRELLSRVDEDLDTREGSYIYDALAPAAVRMSALYRDMDGLILDLFPQTTRQEVLMERFLDTVGLVRKEATKATGEVVVTVVGTVLIPAGTLFSTAVLANSDERPIFFQATQDVVVTGQGTVPVEAVEGGRIGNVFSNTVTMVQSPLTGVISVTNPKAFSGGADIESLEEMRARYIDAVRNPRPYGRPQDYVNWAKAVSGVGGAYVFPQWRGLGTVKVVVTDPESGPVSQSVLNAVAEALEERKVAGIEVSVFTVTTRNIDLTISITIRPGTSLQEVRQAVIDNLNAYLVEVGVGGTVRLSGLSNAVFVTDGVEDYRILQPTGNIPLGDEESARLGTVTWQ